MFNLLKQCAARLCITLATVAPAAVLANALDFPTFLGFDGRYDISTLPGPDVFNVNIATSSTADFVFSNIETPGGPLLASPALFGQAIQLSSGDLIVIIAGTSVLAGQQTQFELNDLALVDSVGVTVGFEHNFDFGIGVKDVALSTDQGLPITAYHLYRIIRSASIQTPESILSTSILTRLISQDSHRRLIRAS